MKKRNRIAILSLCLAAFLSGCGPKIDPNFIPQHFTPERLARMGITVVKLNATIRDASGNGISNVHVSVESPRYVETTRSANDGFFFVTAKYAAGDTLDFRFYGANGLEWTESVSALARGVDSITLRFVESRGRVQLASMEY